MSGEPNAADLKQALLDLSAEALRLFDLIDSGGTAALWDDDRAIASAIGLRGAYLRFAEPVSAMAARRLVALTMRTAGR